MTYRLGKRCIFTSLTAAIATTGPPAGTASSCSADDCHQRFASRISSLESQQELPCTPEPSLPFLYSPYANSAITSLWFRELSTLPRQPKCLSLLFFQCCLLALNSVQSQPPVTFPGIKYRHVYTPQTLKSKQTTSH